MGRGRPGAVDGAAVGTRVVTRSRSGLALSLGRGRGARYQLAVTSETAPAAVGRPRPARWTCEIGGLVDRDQRRTARLRAFRAGLAAGAASAAPTAPEAGGSPHGCLRLRRTLADDVTDKPAAEGLGISIDGLNWRRPGGVGSGGAGDIEVAVARADGGGSWVLMRVAGDPVGRVLVYDQHEWECFLDGVRNGEFDLAD